MPRFAWAGDAHLNTAPEKDPLAIGLGALAAGVGLGGACFGVMLLAIRALQWHEFSRYGDSLSTLDPSYGVAASVTVAVLFGWRRSVPLENGWQQAVITVLSVFGSLFLGILAVPLWHYLEFWGLAGLTVLSLGLGIAGSHWSVRGARSGP